MSRAKGLGPVLSGGGMRRFNLIISAPFWMYVEHDILNLYAETMWRELVKNAGWVVEDNPDIQWEPHPDIFDKIKVSGLARPAIIREHTEIAPQLQGIAQYIPVPELRFESYDIHAVVNGVMVRSNEHNSFLSRERHPMPYIPEADLDSRAWEHVDDEEDIPWYSEDAAHYNPNKGSGDGW